VIEALRNQFDLAWALTDLHLSALTEDDFLWEPAAVVWTLHRGAGGSWHPDWAETEPDPVPVPTIGWLTWHVIYWWSAAVDELTGMPVRPPGEIGWPGPVNSVQAIRSLRDRWREILAALGPDDLGAPCDFPWGPGTGRTVADTVLWLNIELAKNGSEIGLLRILRAAR
jgi:DinB family protein